MAAFSALGFDLSKISTQKYETNTYEPREDFENIRIDVTTAKVMLAASEDGICRIECLEREKEKHSVNAENGTLVIKTMNTEAWYDHIIDFDFGNAAVTVYLPKVAYDTLQISTDVGDVDMPEDFSFRSIDITCVTGDTSCSTSATERIDVQTDVGNIRLNGIKSGGVVHAQTDTGEISLTDVECENLTLESEVGNIILKSVVAEAEFSVKTDTGNVALDGCDGGSILIRTDVGDVTGTLLSDKIIFAESSVGSVDVPESTIGEKCEITSDAGDIKISIKPSFVANLFLRHHRANRRHIRRCLFRHPLLANSSTYLQ